MYVSAEKIGESERVDLLVGHPECHDCTSALNEIQAIIDGVMLMADGLDDDVGHPALGNVSHGVGDDFLGRIDAVRCPHRPRHR